MMERLVRDSMRSRVILCWLVGALVAGKGWGNPIVPYQPDFLPIPLVPELGSRLSTVNSRLQEPRLPLPTFQDLEAIKKVAQILIMLGEQVIPAIIGEPAPPHGHHAAAATIDDVPNDPVNEKEIQ